MTADEPTLPSAVPFVPAGFEPPGGTADGAAGFSLVPLGPEHNDADLRAWTSSLLHIQSTPGFAGRSWPTRVFTAEENLGDLRGHAADFAARCGFTYTVIDDATGEVIGCVYLYPPTRPGFDVDVRSWVRADRAELDVTLHDLVLRWIDEAWPWRAPDHAARPAG